MNVQRAPSVEPRRHWFHLVRLGAVMPEFPLITQRSLVQIQPPQPRRDKGLAVAAADPFVVSATILQPLQRQRPREPCRRGCYHRTPAGRASAPPPRERRA